MSFRRNAPELRCGAHTITVGPLPAVMGILNVTPDSFSDGGRYVARERAVAHARDMATAGAAIIDIGGESTRPGADPVSVQEETDRILPVIEALIQGDTTGGPLDIPVSIDTRKPAVARAAVAAGAGMVNDVTAATDPAMVQVLRDAGDAISIVLMHMKGTPETMQQAPWYDDVAAEVSEYLVARATAIEASGVARERIVLDPGIGFGKRLADNLDLLGSVSALCEAGYPVLIGASRKTFIGRILDQGTDERLAGSLAALVRALDGGASILRVHDVRETVEFLRVLHAIDHPDPWRDDG